MSKETTTLERMPEGETAGVFANLTDPTNLIDAALAWEIAIQQPEPYVPIANPRYQPEQEQKYQAHGSTHVNEIQQFIDRVERQYGTRPHEVHVVDGTMVAVVTTDRTLENYARINNWNNLATYVSQCTPSRNGMITGHSHTRQRRIS